MQGIAQRIRRNGLLISIKFHKKVLSEGGHDEA